MTVFALTNFYGTVYGVWGAGVSRLEEAETADAAVMFESYGLMNVLVALGRNLFVSSASLTVG